MPSDDELSAGPVNAVLVGYGYWGTRMLDIVRRISLLRIVRVVDSRFGTTGFTAPPDVPCVGELSDVLEDPGVEAAIIAVPAVAHGEIARRTLSAGKHVFIEKPLAVSVRDATELLELAAMRDVMLSVDHHYWWSPEVAALHQALQAGAIGTVVRVSAVRAANGPVRFDVDALWDLGAHDISVLVRLGIIRSDSEEQVRVERCHAVLDGPVAGCMTMSGRLALDIAVRIHACWLSERRTRRLVITGDKGTFRLEETDRALSAWLVREGDRILLSRSVKRGSGTPIERALDEFSIEARTGPDRSKAVDAGVVVATLERLARSARPVTTTVRSTRCWL